MKLTTIAVLSISSQCAAFSPSLNKNGASSTRLQMSNPTTSEFLTAETAKKCVEVAGGSPLYAYSMDKLNKNADDCLEFPNAFGVLGTDGRTHRPAESMSACTTMHI